VLEGVLTGEHASPR